MKRVRKNSKCNQTAFESLEVRQLLSSSLNAGILTITGGSGVDNVTITESGVNYVVAEKGLPAKNYLIAAVGEIVANLNGGNDIFGMQSTITIPASVSGGSGNDLLVGAGGKDSISGGSGNDTIIGQGNDDQLSGNDGNDAIYGNGGVDALIGGSGNDTMDGSLGNDFYDGGTGSDTVSYGNRSTKVTAELDTDYANAPKQVTGFGGVVGEHDTYINVENLNGGAAGDSLRYHAASFPSNKNFSIPIDLYGGPGNDTIAADSSFGSGGLPNDFGYTVITEEGAQGNDHLFHDHAVSTKMVGGDGNDTVDQIFDDNATPPISFNGGAGHDQWFDGATTSSSYTLDMSNGVEDVFAENSGGAHVTIKGNSADNTIDFSGNTNATVSIDAMGGNDTVSLGDNFDGDTLHAATVIGGSGNDKITDNTSGVTNKCKDIFDGGSGNDTLIAGDGNDSLTGGSGHDQLFGQGGNDTLIGNDGDKDTLDGGSGSDKAKKDGIDVVTNVETFI